MAVATAPFRKARARPAERVGWRRVHIVWAQLAAIAAIIIALPFGREVDPDFWWHLRTGELIFHNGVPRHDVFSFTVPDQSWVAHEWLSEIIIYDMQSLFGYAGNALLFAGATLGALALMYSLARRAGAGTKPLVALTLLATVTLAFFITVRPQVFTWLLFAAFLYIIERYEQGQRGALWALPPLMALWVNLHLGFVYGLLIVGVWVASKIWQSVRGGGALMLQEPVTAGAACLLATMLNPHGPAIFGYIVNYFFEGKTERALIQEWQRPYFGLTVMWPLLAATIVILASVASRNRPRFYLCVLSIIFVVLSAQAARNVPFVGLLVVPVGAMAAAQRWPGARREADSRLRVSTASAAAFAIGIGAFVLIMSAHLHDALSGWRPSSAGYPAGAVAALQDEAPGANIYAAYDWGGYVIDKLYPGARVFVDGRADVYGPEIVNDYVSIAMTDPGWLDKLDAYGVDAVLFPPNTRLSVSLRREPGWEEVYMDSEASLFLKRVLGAP